MKISILLVVFLLVVMAEEIGARRRARCKTRCKTRCRHRRDDNLEQMKKEVLNSVVASQTDKNKREVVRDAKDQLSSVNSVEEMRRLFYNE